MRTEPSYCRICPALCGILVDLDDEGRAVRIRGDRDHPLSKGFTCPKGRALPEEHAAADRLLASARRMPAGWRPLGSSQALDEVAERLTAVIAEHGPRSVALYVGTRGYEVLNLAAATAWLRGIGSPSLYSTYTIDQPGKDLARAMHGSWSAGFQDASSSDVVLFAGNNPLVSATSSYIAFPATNVNAELRAMKDRGLRVIVIDPRRTETAVWADVHLQPRPGQDAAVLGGMLRELLATGCYDREFVAAHAAGLEKLRDAVEPFTPEMVADRAGVPAEELRRATALFGAARRGCAVGGTGLNMSPHPVLNEYLLLCLNTICGRYVRAGEEVANPGVLTQGRRPLAAVRGPRPIWGRGPQPRVRGLSTLYDQMPASALADEILTPGEGQVRALVVSGGNPAVALPDQTRAVTGLRSLELLVCLDVRHTATTELADYVLACKLSLEKADTTLASDLRFPRPFAQWTPPVATPPGDLLDEWEVFHGLAARMGTTWDLTGTVGMPNPLAVGGSLPAGRLPTSDELWNLLCAGGRVPLAEVRRHRHGYAPPAGAVVVEEPADARGDRFQLADSLLMAELGATLGELEDDDYPYRLISRRMWEYENSWGQDVPSVRGKWGANPAFVNPVDLAELGLADGGTVCISSRRATVTATARAADDLPRGVVSMAHCWGGVDDDDDDLARLGTSTSRLVDAHDRPSQLVGMARQSAIPIRITSLEGAP
jgi:anaerobic selenocysteine-containing dehydrogenase